MSPKPLCVLALLLVVLVGSSSAQRVDYSGYTEYDGRPAVLTLTFNGPVVTGNLFVSPVCEEGVHLTGVDIDLTGTASGPWENAATSVVGGWSGGDTDPCDASSTIRNNPLYPNNGTFTISMTKTNDGKDAVRLVRMPTGYGYMFGSKGSVYEGAGGTGSTGQGVDLKILELSVPSGIAPGKVAEILVTFSNVGGASSGPFNLYGYAFPNQNNLIYKSDPAPVQGLGAGETKSVTLSIPIPPNAPDVPYDIKVAIDNSNYAGSGDVLETNENNNEKWKRKVQEPEVSTSAGSKVDLVVVSVLDDPNQAAAASDQLTFTMELKNLGTVEERGFNVGFYLSPDRSITADDIYIGYGVVGLKPGESKSGPVPCKIPADITPGLYYIGVIADPQEKVVESDETNNAKATEDPVRIPRSLVIFSSDSDVAGDDLASGRPGSGSEVVHLQKGQTHTFQMPIADTVDQVRFGDAGVNSISHWYGHDNFVNWGPSGVLSGDGEETLGSGTTITLLAVDEGTATVRMTAFWESSKSDGSVGHGYQDFSWTVIVGSFGSDNDTDTMPGSFSGTVSKGEITSGKIKGKAIYRPTGEPVAGAVIIGLDFEDEARGSYPIQKLNSDGLKTGSDGTFEIDIATCIPSGVDPGTFWIRMIKFYDGPLAQDLWGTTDLDLWVVQSPLKTFTLTNESVQAGPIDVGIVMMDKACKVFGTECPYEPNWP
ncbi:MAG TPA: CARDB domain-containing protein [Methanothrix sp.]|nr:CARDB domain-containing protein [Methanothrix sp.]